MIRIVARKIFLGIRIEPELRKALAEIGKNEQRSLSQICELLLRKGIEAYEREGPKYLQRPLSRQKTNVAE
jgi:hypothetical protein